MSTKTTIVYPNGDVFEGYDEANKKKDGKMIFANGNVYKGKLHKDLFEGYGELTYANGDKYIGDFKSGWKTKGKMLYSNQSVYEGTWTGDREELYNGMGKLYDTQTGSIYRGHWKRGKKDGRGLMIYANGSKYNGNWVDDEKQDDLEEDRQKSSITVSILAHGEDLQLLPDDMKNMNVRILSASGESGCLNYLGSKDKQNEYFSYQNDPTFFNRRKTTYENLKQVQDYLNSIDPQQQPSQREKPQKHSDKLTGQAYSKKLRNKIFTPVINHRYSFFDPKLRLQTHFVVNDIRNNKNVPFIVNDDLRDFDLLQKYRMLTDFSPSTIARGLYFGSDEWFNNLDMNEFVKIMDEKEIQMFNHEDINKKFTASLKIAKELKKANIKNLDAIEDGKYEDSPEISKIIKTALNVYRNSMKTHKKDLPIFDVVKETESANRGNNRQLYLAAILKIFKQAYGFEVVNIIDFSCRLFHLDNMDLILKNRQIENEALKNINMVDG